MPVPLLELSAITHRFPDGTKGLDGASFILQRGEFAVLAGRNGSGKTLLMRHMNGLLSPTSGEARVDGRPVAENPPETRRKIGLVFQDADAQIVGQTVARDIAFGPENLRLPRGEIDRRVVAALEATGLEGFDNRRPHTLSGGEKRRLSVAGVLAMEPELMVLDEPFTGLDWPGSRDLLAVLDRLHDAGTALLVITHDLEKILAHAGRLILMDSGRIVFDGAPAKGLDRLPSLGVFRPSGPVESMSWAETS